MAMRFGLGPVFATECLTTPRRWQVYAGRTLLVGGLLIGLTLVWYSRFARQQLNTLQAIAVIGSAFFDTIMGVELVLALIVVPAVTAGAICQDKMQGSLTLMMVSDLSDAEIVLGKLASRLVTVLGVVTCGLPVIAITTFLGGIDPWDSVGGSLVIVGVSTLGTCVAMTYSVWARKPHEALMATYATLAVWLLSLLVWSETSRGTTPYILRVTNPFWLLFGAKWGLGPGARTQFVACVVFFAVSLAISVVIAAVSTWRIRTVTLRQTGRSDVAIVSRTNGVVAWLPWRGDPEAMLDRSPMLWREWHRRQPSSWARTIWRLYVVLSILFILLGILGNPTIVPGGCAFMVTIGLLMVSVTAATALAEERAQGSLEILLATPIATREIVLGKWWGAFRVVPSVAILAGGIALGAALTQSDWHRTLPIAVTVVPLVFAYGAAITSFGLAMATCQPRLGRAIGASVAGYLAATIIYPMIVLLVVRAGPNDMVWLWPSPFFGMLIPMGWISWRRFSDLGERFLAMQVWVVLTFLFAYGLRYATLISFDRCLGRVPSRDDSRARSANRRSELPMFPVSVPEKTSAPPSRL